MFELAKALIARVFKLNRVDCTSPNMDSFYLVNSWIRLAFISQCLVFLSKNSDTLRCQDSSVEKLFPIYSMVNDSNPPSANLSLLSKEICPLPVISSGRNHRVWSHREERPGYCSISKKLLSVQISAFDI